MTRFESRVLIHFESPFFPNVVTLESNPRYRKSEAHSSHSKFLPRICEVARPITVVPMEPELPRLVAGPTRNDKPSLARKRTRDSGLSGTSSDPPLFSSDDASASLETYAHPRKKQLYYGPWWAPNAHVLSAPKGQPSKKRAFERNYDSGVWMGSEASSDLPSDFLTEQDEESPSKAFRPENVTKWTEPQQRARDIIEHSLERAVESIDLSRLGLDDLPGEILDPLKYFVREPPSSGEFNSLEASLHLYLSGNQISQVPVEVYSLNLTVLSLRHNEIKSLSPAIIQLTRLQECNLSSNKLRYLPWEILFKTPLAPLL